MQAMDNGRAGLAAYVGRGAVAGLAGTAVMTAFQTLVEMPATGRGESYAPAQFAERITPVRPAGDAGRRRLNYIAHFSLGLMWGTGYGLAAFAGWRGQRAANTVFAAVYASDVGLNTALGLYEPTKWSKQDWVVDLIDKYVQAQATGAAFDYLLDPGRRA